MAFYTYILASRRYGTLYTGSTEDLLNRVGQHKAKAVGGFTARHGVDQLVWYQVHNTREGAFLKERRIKKWNRAWKVGMIEAFNPEWRDLFDEIRLGDLRDAPDWGPRLRGDERRAKMTDIPEGSPAPHFDLPTAGGAASRATV